MAYATIDKPSKYFTAKTYTGTGSTQSITGLEFSPDWVWIKDRTNGSANHNLFDVLRIWSGDSLPARLYSNTTDAEESTTYLGASNLTAFNSDGFTLGTGGNTNTNTNSYVSWCWDANGAGVSNTSGSITSTVSANTTSGFSIVTYTGNGTTGATIGHGLGVAPKMIIVKNRDNAYNWIVYHATTGNTGDLKLQANGAFGVDSNDWNNTSPTSTVFTVGNNIAVNNSGNSHVAYCFADVKGFSKFGGYTGNGSTDGTFVYTGFKPAFLLAKSSSTANRQWYIVDNKRSTSDGNNVLNKTLAPNQSNDESWWGTNNYVDFVSNGFKFRDSYDGLNESGGTYIYMAFASSPFVSSKSIPTTAR
jgi:hypothetical protein